MTTADAIMKAILAEPDEDTHRLVWADAWEEEGGDPARSAWVRRQCADSCQTIELRHNFAYYQSGLGKVADCPAWAESCVWSRGFISAVTCTAADWLAYADEILAAHPVREVTLTSLPEIESRFVGVGFEYSRIETRLAGRRAWHPAIGVADTLALEWPRVRTWHLPAEEGSPFTSGNSGTVTFGGQTLRVGSWDIPASAVTEADLPLGALRPVEGTFTGTLNDEALRAVLRGPDHAARMRWRRWVPRSLRD